MDYRVEKDLLGEIKLPQEAYYGIHTARAAGNFPVSRMRVHPSLIRSLAQVKQAAAQANMGAGLLDPRIGKAIYRAASEVAAGELAEQFILDPLQGGAGTSTNMNMNEVIANRAIELLKGKKGDYSLVHPLAHVNLSQSTNDVYPTALRVAAIGLVLELSEVMEGLQASLQEKEAQFAGIIKLGRTQLQDAVPVTLGQEFSAYAEAVARDRWRLYKVEERLRQVNLGGTAIGTGLNAQPEYVFLVIEELQSITGYGLARAENTVDLTQNADVFVEVSGLLKAAAVNLAKIAGDLRLLSSGPLGGLSEIRLPEVQAGSTIMPGKINPVIPEMVTQVSFQVMGNDQVIAISAASGQLELNAFMPLIAQNLLQSLHMLINSARLLNEKCVKGIVADEARCRHWLEESHAFITALTPYLGYELAAEIVKKTITSGNKLKDTIVDLGYFTQKEIEAIMAPGELTKPGVAGARYIKKRNKK